MSKRKFKKFKKVKHLKQQVTASQNSANTVDQIRDELIDEVATFDKTEQKEAEPDFYLTDKYDHVKKDIKKILIIMFSIFIILFGTYYFSLKTQYLNTLGSWIYKILNIQA